MKKTLTGVVALLAGAFVAHSQGTVSFANYGVLSPYIYVKLGTTPLGGTSGTATGNATTDVGKGNDWTVALYGNAGSGDAASTLVQLQTSTAQNVTANFATGTSADKTAGTWFSSLVAQVPGTTLAGQAATVQLYAWYNNGGTITSYSAASVRGFSATGNVTTGGPNSSGPPSTAPNMPALGNFTVVGTPEPSTIALGVMGASGMLLRLRRKK
jgi:hypothetical protein